VVFAGARGAGTEDDESGYESGRYALRMSTDSLDSSMDDLGWSVASLHPHHFPAVAEGAGSQRTGVPHYAAPPLSGRLESGRNRADSAGSAAGGILQRPQAQARKQGSPPPRAAVEGIVLGSHKHRSPKSASSSPKHTLLAVSLFTTEEECAEIAQAGAETDVDVEVQNVEYSDDGGDEADSEDNDSKEEDRVFEIPSVFEGGHRSMPSSSSHSNASSGRLFKEGTLRSRFCSCFRTCCE
jgi:hypothetical protein